MKNLPILFEVEIEKRKKCFFETETEVVLEFELEFVFVFEVACASFFEFEFERELVQLSSILVIKSKRRAMSLTIVISSERSAPFVISSERSESRNLVIAGAFFSSHTRFLRFVRPPWRTHFGRNDSGGSPFGLGRNDRFRARDIALRGGADVTAHSVEDDHLRTAENLLDGSVFREGLEPFDQAAKSLDERLRVQLPDVVASDGG